MRSNISLSPRNRMSAPGNALPSKRATTWLQNQPVLSENSCITSNQLTRIPDSTGITNAHRNGLLLAQAEHSINQPTVGKAHTAYTGSDTNNAEATCNGLAGAQTSASGLPPCASTTMLSKMKNPNPEMMPVKERSKEHTSRPQ